MKMQYQTKKPRWTTNLDFGGARKLMENADAALEKIQEVYIKRREQLVNMKKAAKRNGRT